MEIFEVARLAVVVPAADEDEVLEAAVGFATAADDEVGLGFAFPVQCNAC